jgi:hypothetical protein
VRVWATHAVSGHSECIEGDGVLVCVPLYSLYSPYTVLPRCVSVRSSLYTVLTIYSTP